jgi:hypothetical protein
VIKIAYTVFHHPQLDVNNERSENVQKIREHFSKYLDFIDSETILVQKIKDIKVSQKKHKELSKLKFSGTFRLGAIGLIFTTFIFYKKILNADYDYYLVIEDDASVYPNSASQIISYANELPDDADILSLYENPFFYYNYSEKNFNCDLENICLNYNRLSTMGYLISKNAAEKYFNFMSVIIDNPIDLYLFDPEKDTKKYSLKPFAEQVFYSNFFRKDNGEPMDEHSAINNTVEVRFRNN